jgi:hypothetical protein
MEFTLHTEEQLENGNAINKSAGLEAFLRPFDSIVWDCIWEGGRRKRVREKVASEV